MLMQDVRSVSGQAEYRSKNTNMNSGLQNRIVVTVVVGIMAVAAHAAATGAAPTGLEKATFAGGCFWCMQPPFRKLPGVVKVTAGYTGGHVSDPGYEQVSSGGTGHAESVEVIFDPQKISYRKLLDVFWHNVDPTQRDRQFCDVGDQYRSAIFYHSPRQERAAEASLDALKASSRFAGKTLYTQIVAAGPFYAAEEYHQNYAQKHPLRYRFYRWNCGRDQRLKQVWGQAPEH